MADRAAQCKAVISLMEDGKSEHAACAEVGINRNTFRSQALKIGIADEYAKAMATLAQAQVEKIELAVDDMRSGEYDSKAARVEIDARKWLASKFLPKQYGDRQQIEHSGAISQGSPEQVMQQLVAMSTEHPTMKPVIKDWLARALEAIG